MLSTWEAIKQRRTIRKFVPHKDVSDEIIKQLLEAARLAPSGTNAQPWRFIVVRDKEVRKQLCRLRLEQWLIEEAPVAIVCFANLDRYSQQATRQRHKELEAAGVIAEATGRFADPKFWEERDSAPTPPREQILMNAIPNTFIAIEHILLMATALGVGTCWVGATNDAKLNQLFGLPDNLVSVAVVAVGYPAGEIPPQRPRLSLEEILLKPLPQYTGEEARVR